jgi:hypothetical protein
LKKYLLFALPVFVLFLNGCKKDAPDFSGFTGVESSGDYLPSKKGTYWKYETDFAGTQGTATITLTGETTLIDGKTYLNITSEDESDVVENGYYYGGNHVYSLTAAEAGLTLEFEYLHDNVGVGETWTAKLTPDGNLAGTPARLQGKIIESDVTKTVLGKDFTGVIHTRIVLQYDSGSGFEDSGTYDYYIAKGVGLIQIDSDLGGELSSSKLKEYSIK